MSGFVACTQIPSDFVVCPLVRVAVGDLTVYVYEGILLLCSHAPYDRADLSNTLAHITNTAKQAGKHKSGGPYAGHA